MLLETVIVFCLFVFIMPYISETAYYWIMNYFLMGIGYIIFGGTIVFVGLLILGDLESSIKVISLLILCGYLTNHISHAKA